ncbi:hypothetical protein ACFYVW_08960 [Streptomyces tendae]|uniref:hypothetical protein n=1 Tax=Streptomyces tendae TaxID=1932 RepID=UPI0036746739
MALKTKLVPQPLYRRQLAARLRELREASGLTLDLVRADKAQQNPWWRKYSTGRTA